MRMGSMMWLVVSGLVTTAAAAPSDHRLVIVVAQANDPRAPQQHAWLAQDAVALRDRDVVERDITPEAAHRARPELGVSSGIAFEVLLVGKDGGIKLRRFTPVAASEITALIDAMPMRQDEVRRR